MWSRWCRPTGACYLVVQPPRRVRLFVTPMDCSTPGLTVPHHFPKSAQVHVHCISDVIQPSHPLTHSSPSALKSFPPPFSSVQSLDRVRLCGLMDCSTSGFPVHQQLPEFTQTHIHQVSDVIQPSHPLSSPSPAM